MDSGMIRRIQQFTTQNIPVATIAGLEPKSPEPKMYAPRPAGGAPARFGGKPGFGKKPFAPRGGEGFSPRGGEGFSPRGGDHRAPRDRSPFDRSAGHFEPRAAHGADAPRSPFDRAARPAGFTPHKPGAPAGKGGFKPARPRPGGYTR
jgi:hypothetical protein